MLTRFAPRTTLAALALLTLAACPDVDEPLSAPIAAQAPVQLSGRVGFLDPANQTLHVLDPADPRLRPQRFRTGAEPALVTPWAGGAGALVLSRGRKPAPGIAGEPARLEIVRFDGVAGAVYPLGARYNALAQSPDGRFAVLSFSGNAGTDGAVFNPNEIAIVNLIKPAGLAAPVTRTIRSLGGVPLGIAFSPLLGDAALPGARTLPDGPRAFAVLLSENYVTLLDLDHLERSEITVPLVLPDDTRKVRPVQVLFDASDATAFVRAGNSQDVYAVKLVAVPPAERAGHDVRASLSPLGVGGQPTDAAIIRGPDGRARVLVTSAAGAVVVLDPATERSTSITVPFGPERLVLFDGVAPGEAKVKPRALVLGAATQLGFLDLEGLEDRRTRNLDVRSLGIVPGDTMLLPDRAQLVVLAKGAPGISVLDLGRRTAAPLVTPKALVDLQILGGRLWYRLGEDPRVGFIDLGTLQPGEVALDAPVTGLLAVPGAARSSVVAVHRSALGAVTVVDGVAPDRATARSVEGLFLQDLFAAEGAQ